MLTFLQCDRFDVEQDAATVSLGADESFDLVQGDRIGGEECFSDRPDGPGPQLQRHLANDAELDDLGLVLQADVERRQAGGGEAQRAALDDPRR